MSTAENLAEIAKVSPPLAYTGMKIIGYPIGELASLFAAIYTLILLLLLVRRWLLSTHRWWLARKRTDNNCVTDCADAARGSHEYER